MKTNFKFQQDVNSTQPWGINTTGNHIKMESTKNYIKYTGSNSEIKIIGNRKKEDLDIKKMVLSIIKWNSSIDESQIKITVEDGWVILEGRVDMEFKRTKAELLAKDIKGVIAVTNRITVAPNLHS